MVKSRLLNKDPSTDIGIVYPKNIEEEAMLEPSNLITDIGVRANVVQTRTTYGNQPSVMITVLGSCRFRIQKLIMEEPYPVALVSSIDNNLEIDYKDADELANVHSEFTSVLKNILNMVNPSVPAVIALKKNMNHIQPSILADISTSLAPLSHADKLDILKTLGVKERMKKLIPILKRTWEVSEVDQPLKKIDPEVSSNIGLPSSRSSQPQTLILYRGGNRGSSMDDDSDISELVNNLKKAKLPPHAEQVASRELKRMMSIGRYSPDYGVIRSYLEVLAELPWQCSSPDVIDIQKAGLELDLNHYGMKDLKKRILEFLAVRHLKGDIKGPILCFVGPPGVGKTSIARSVARALGRKFHQIALGGVCHQSDIRGHRKTYVGAMPGRIIQALKTTGVNNPVILLDEVDKMGKGAHSGDPASALLEVLDPEQNSNFVDHYVNIPFDLSQILFIASANVQNKIPFALYDRLEVINIPGYTTEEKLRIAERHLLPKVITEHGLNDGWMSVPRDSLKLIISSYTLEAGVRSLEKRISALCRSIAYKVAKQDTAIGKNNDLETVSTSGLGIKSLSFPIVLDKAAVEDILGPPVYDNSLLWYRLGIPGTSVGLAGSYHGGSITIVECFAFPKCKPEGVSLQVTGSVGEVMHESAQLALNWVRTNYNKFALYEALLSEKREIESRTIMAYPIDSEIHIHFPAGAVSKEGPSAGITIATALVSLFLNTPVAANLAMTGELTLKGFVLPVGGIKQKVLAAYENGFKRVILPKINAKDLSDIPKEVKDEIEFVFVSTMEDVLHSAFNGAVSLTPLDERDPLISKL